MHGNDKESKIIGAQHPQSLNEMLVRKIRKHKITDNSSQQLISVQAST